MNPSSSNSSLPPPDDLFWELLEGADIKKNHEEGEKKNHEEGDKEKTQIQRCPVFYEPQDPEDEDALWYKRLDTDDEAFERWKKYVTQIEESGGYDIDVVPHYHPGFIYIPCPWFREDKMLHKDVKKMAKEALKTFRDDSGKRYRLLYVEKLVYTTTLLYFITFKVKLRHAPSPYDSKADDVVKTMQAEIFDRFTHYEVRCCRFKPTN